jgi:glycerol-3-phosphate cytidylyltransferase-like family protein
VLVWVLEAMRMEHPSHMTPLSQCWKLNRPPPDETKGKKRTELFKTQLHKFDTITKEHKVHINIIAHVMDQSISVHLLTYLLQQMKEKPKFLSVAEMIKTQQNTLGKLKCVQWLQFEC